MRENEFVKLNGIAAAKDLVTESGWRNTPFLIKIKRLVESWELVEFYGGLECSKGRLEYFDWMPTGLQNYSRLSKAIADVESCQ